MESNIIASNVMHKYYKKKQKTTQAQQSTVKVA